MSAPHYEDDHVTLHHGDCLEVMASLPAESVHAIVTDPPYGLEFMGKGWDAPWEERDVNADAGFHGGGVSATRNAPSFTGSTNPKCLTCKGTRRGRRDGTAKVAVCLCPDGGRFPNVRAVEMRAFQDWCEQWARECLRVLKPGGHLLAFGGSRTWHRLAVAVEDAGFEIRDSIAWLYGSGFPKSLDVSKAIDKAVGAEREVVGLAGRSGSGRTSMDAGTRSGDLAGDYFNTSPATPEAARWQGWGTALKPAFEPIVVARKPLTGTVAGNVLAHGTGALNIDGCRVRTDEPLGRFNNARTEGSSYVVQREAGLIDNSGGLGRWPANVLLDDTQTAELDKQSGESVSRPAEGVKRHGRSGGIMGAEGALRDGRPEGHADSGGASRFFPTFRYEAKAPADERPRYHKSVLRLRDDLTPEQVDHVRARLAEAGVRVD